MVDDIPEAQSRLEEIQGGFCRARGIQYVATPGDSKLGFALSTEGLLPLNGLRHPAVGDTSGWYIWGGERFSDAPDFFSPVHAKHVFQGRPELIGLLGLPPGYRFLVAGDHLDIWCDPSLLDV